VIIVKHLAREFDRRPQWIRRRLRREFGDCPVGKRWEWDEGREADEIRAWLRKLLNGEGER
jgi:hypothetical protein